ncbi:hypothetical protein Y032_0003g1486 [Ancylostoma ceylanicum]|uniref:K Homology domain-containing protein n=1 Tax=Ancylostoma ceylanicum TaxID=53326 RepID=A0A016VXW6_9BILA|nr:hypothetical protein Y032_0003g1486 [Ancylostoma ceylanicum]
MGPRTASGGDQYVRRDATAPHAYASQILGRGGRNLQLVNRRNWPIAELERTVVSSITLCSRLFCVIPRKKKLRGPPYFSASSWISDLSVN